MTRGFAITLAAATVLLAAADSVAQQTQKCAVGTKVTLKEGSSGTLAEIGTESPHVGWYRIVFSWSPKGEWYNPATWETNVTGTTIKCVVNEPAAPRPATTAPATTTAPKPATPGAAAPPVVADCPFVEPPGTVTKSSPANEQTFKRVIYEREAAKVNPGSISAPKKVGLTFLAFTLEKPYKNTLTSTRFGDKRLHTGAPVDTMIYPIKTTQLQCDLHGSEVRRTLSERSHDCFISRSGQWTCPGSTTKTIETRLIPAR